MAITEDYISFETAKLLKEKGFDEPVERFFNADGLPCRGESAYNWNDCADVGEEAKDYSRPSLQMAMKWLREEKHIPIEILWHYDSNSDVEEWCFVHHAELRILPNDIEYYETYEQACEQAIKYCLENLI